MSLNGITDSFCQHAKVNPKQYKHLKEILNQAILKLKEEEEIQILLAKIK